MTAPTTGKLVRDGIPDIIRAEGAEPCTRIARPAEYRRLLLDKLYEETNEVLGADDAGILGELADVLEVVCAIAADCGTDSAHLEELRAAKAAERGGFAGRVVWSGNLEVAALATAGRASLSSDAANMHPDPSPHWAIVMRRDLQAVLRPTGERDTADARAVMRIAREAEWKPGVRPRRRGGSVSDSPVDRPLTAAEVRAMREQLGDDPGAVTSLCTDDANGPDDPAWHADCAGCGCPCHGDFMLGADAEVMPK